MLTGMRVLDLADEKGFVCGKILADLGAEVIKVEKPGGDSSRMIPPFYKEEPHPEMSFYWWAYNLNKKGVTLNIKDREGQELLRQLVKTADAIVETFPPGFLDKYKLGYSSLQRTNPRIIMLSITPFGQTGPYKDYKTSDLVAMALSGYMSATGDPDRAPVRPSFPQAYLRSGSEAAVAILIACYYREETGEGQYIDLSVHDSISTISANIGPTWELNKRYLKRAGQLRTGLTTIARARQTWECKDGYVCFYIGTGRQHAAAQRSLIGWMEEEGMADDWLRKIDWDSFDMALASQDFFDELEPRIISWLKTHTKSELYEGGLRRGIPIYPVYSVDEIIKDSQLQARKFWMEIEHARLDTKIIYPGPFFDSSIAPYQVKQIAPGVGEHNEEIYLKEMGLSQEEFNLYRQKGVI